MDNPADPVDDGLPPMVDPSAGREADSGVAIDGEANTDGPIDGYILDGDYAPYGYMDSHTSGSQTDDRGDGRGIFTPIAICGMACRLPGGIKSPRELWDFLMAGRDARGRVPESRYNINSWFSPVKKADTTVTEHGYFLDESVDLGALDTSFFTMSRSEVERMDPQQRMLLEVAREALEDSCEIGWQGENIGVYCGTYGQDWYDVFNRETQKFSAYQATATQDFMLSERVSHELDLRGPSVTIRTACSSSMIALNDACMAIARGDCKAAIIGGTSLVMSPANATANSEQGVYSPDGSCKTFSENADGYGRGEAIVAIYVKSLRAALRDGSPVRAVVSGSAANSGGKTNNMSVPNPKPQEALIRRAYEVAGIIDIGKTALFECHGTGSNIGDLNETNAIAAVFGESGIYIASTKPNIGHAEGAAGLTSLVKAVLCLEHRTIPPHIKLHMPNPKIPWEAAKLKVPIEPTPWPSDRAERISINSSNIAGVNGHCILESAATFHANRSIAQRRETPADELHMFLFSANTPYSLNEMLQQYQAFLEETTEDLGNVAFTLANKREHLPFRSFIVGSRDNPGLPAPVPTAVAIENPSLVMVFTGQGAQWPQMGRDLLRSNPVFRNTIRTLDKHLLTLGSAAPGWSLEQELCKPIAISRVDEAEFTQPLCTAVQLGLVDAFAAVGVKPAAVVGHASGEFAAAYAAGALTAEEAIVVASYRGTITKLQTRRGGMAAVGVGREEASRYLVDGVVIAFDNSHSSVTLSGDVEELEMVVREIKEADPGVLANILNSEKAYHSHHMVEIGNRYHRALTVSGIVGRHPAIPFFSSVTGEVVTAEQGPLGPQYWRDNLETTVRFRSAMCRILEHPDVENPVFLEVGPHPVLASTLRQICTHQSSNAPHVATLTRQQDGQGSFLTAIAKLYTFRVVADFKALMQRGSSVPGLPPYPWDHQQRFWYESRVSKEWRKGGHPYHDLLGRIMPESTVHEPMWRNLLHLENVPWLTDHTTKQGIIYPSSAFLSMAAEAVQQAEARSLDSVGFRHVFFVKPMVVSEDRNAVSELVTVFRRHRLTDLLDSEWWDFSISSHDGSEWTKHCTGEVRAETEPLKDSQPIGDLPRRVPRQEWYQAAKKQGLDYGKQFQTLQEITASTVHPHTAKAELRNNWQGDEAMYHIHPIIVESYFQLLNLAARDGRTSEYKRLVPKRIRSVKLSRCSADDLIMSVVADRSGYDIVGQGTAIIGSCKTVLQVSGARMVPQEESEIDDGPKFPITARSEFVPDLEFEDLRSLVGPVYNHEEYALTLEELAQLAVSFCKRLATETRKESPGHLKRYKAWLDEQPDSALNDGVEALKSRIDSLVGRLGSTPAAPVANAVAKVCDNIEPILAADKEVMELFSIDTRNVAEFMKVYDVSEILRHLGHIKPNLQVLELGAGRGDATLKILKSLTHARGQPLYSKYVFSDVSTAFTIAAKERFSSVANMEFVSVDINRDLSEIAFENRQFDLVIAAGIIHESPNIQRALGNISKLLTSNGRAILQDPLPGLLWAKLIFGTLPDWWCGSELDREEWPYLSLQQWEKEMEMAGLEIQDAIFPDAPGPFAINTIAIAKLKRERSWSTNITLLCHSETSQSKDLVIGELEARGYNLTLCTIEEVPPQGQDIISLLDLEQAFWEDIDEGSFSSFKSFVGNLGDSGILWVTKPCQVNVQDPRYAPIIGLSRTIRNEIAVDFATCEVDEWNSPKATKAICDVFRKFQQREMNGILGPDYEYAIDSGRVLINRIFPFSLDDDIRNKTPSDGAVLSIGKPGHPKTLAWVPQPAVAPREDEIQMDVHAAGLNSRDLAVAMGHVEDPERSFGHEAAGVVQHVGSKATRFRVGDCVVHLGTSTVSTEVTASEMLFERLPDGLSFEDGASIPLVFPTAIYGLLDVARLSKAQSVLIHSATGGLGLAAIQIAKMVGADIHSTVSNDDKARYLTETFEIPPHRIYDSRSTSFVDDVMRETGGKGVDVVLNSLSGEFLHSTWKCVGKWGTMVELGKTDLVGAGKLDMQPFLNNRSYCGIDMDQMVRERPWIVNRYHRALDLPFDIPSVGLTRSSLLARAMAYLSQGSIRPIRLDRVSSASAVRETFEYLAQSKHIGKVVLQLRDGEGNLDFGDTVAAKKTTAKLDGSASYLLVDGLGSFGRAISVWMVEHGARNLTFLSRSVGSRHHDKEFEDELVSMGCIVQLVRGSVTSPDDVSRAVDGTAAPLKGIIQMSMVLRNQAFSQMTIEDWNHCVDPKITGTWNLHEVTRSRGSKLDFFVLFSSLSGVVGQLGQANYAAASTFLDAFVQHRERLQLPATCIALGAMEGSDYSTANPAGLRLTREGELLDALNAAITLQSIPRQSQSVTDSPILIGRNRFILGIAPLVPLSSPESNTKLRHDVHLAVWHNTSNQTTASVEATDVLRPFLAMARKMPETLKTPEAVDLLGSEIGKQLSNLLMKPDEGIDLSLTTAELGIDSVVAVEMRAWWRSKLGLDITVKEMMNTGTLEALGRRAAEGLLALHG